MLHAKLCTDEDIYCLCVRPTGGGKYLLFTIFAVCLGNMTLAITQLLSLGTNQTIKHQHKTSGASRMLNSAYSDKISNNLDVKLSITEM